MHMVLDLACSKKRAVIIGYKHGRILEFGGKEWVLVNVGFWWWMVHA